MIYLIGSMRNPSVPALAHKLRAEGLQVFDDWYSPGPRADDHWREYEIARGRTYLQALEGAHAKTVFEFDRTHLLLSSAVVLVAPAGRSAHLELGWCLGRGKPGFVYLGQIERWDIMYRFATAVFDDPAALAARLKEIDELQPEGV